jgi:hypothetical protein
MDPQKINFNRTIDASTYWYLMLEFIKVDNHDKCLVFN